MPKPREQTLVRLWPHRLENECVVGARMETDRRDGVLRYRRVDAEVAHSRQHLWLGRRLRDGRGSGRRRQRGRLGAAAAEGREQQGDSAQKADSYCEREPAGAPLGSPPMGPEPSGMP
jgi:hypothetical protein